MVFQEFIRGINKNKFILQKNNYFCLVVSFLVCEVPFTAFYVSDEDPDDASYEELFSSREVSLRRNSHETNAVAKGNKSPNLIKILEKGN